MGWHAVWANHLCMCRPTMILYNIDNIRDLFGHKVGDPSCCLSKVLVQLMMHCNCMQRSC